MADVGYVLPSHLIRAFKKFNCALQPKFGMGHGAAVTQRLQIMIMLCCDFIVLLCVAAMYTHISASAVPDAFVWTRHSISPQSFHKSSSCTLRHCNFRQVLICTHLQSLCVDFQHAVTRAQLSRTVSLPDFCRNRHC